MPRRRTSSLPIHGTSAVPCQQRASVPSSADHPLPQQQHSKSTPLVSAAWKPPRKEEGQLDNDAIDDPRGGPLKLDDLQLNVLAKSDAFLVLNKVHSVLTCGESPDIDRTPTSVSTVTSTTLVSILVAASVLTRSSMILCRSTAAASGLFAKKCAEKEYLALVHGTMPFTPPRGHKCCTLSRVPDFIHDKDHPKVILQHQHKFTKQFKGTLRFDAQVKAMEAETLPVHVRYDLPLLQPHAFAAGPIGTSASSRPRSMSDLSCPSKRSRLNNMASTSEPMGYIFDDSISPSTTNSFQMEISPNGKV
ncbi:hypothetical protein B5M09_005711 [Aphanomyces astaci]|uniref:Uncharacterized protein n=1 Tax=Aphanomyces astaci TaxID=112090 RepID=A0A3R8DBA9_APHAT|nr:hypothetical protein B5M09_005711 [Aphanomyces astaci]